MYTPTEHELRILGMVTRYSSHRLRVPYEDLYNYLLERLDAPRRNFDPSLGKDYKKYFEISLRLMSLNFIRDKGWAAKINSSKLRLVAKVKKYGIAAAARRLTYSEDELRELLRSFKSAQRNNTTEISKVAPYLASDISEIDNPYVQFVNHLGGINIVKDMAPDRVKQLWEDFNKD